MSYEEFVRQVWAEFAARGWNAILHGPEVHLVLPIVGAMILTVSIILILNERR